MTDAILCIDYDVHPDHRACSAAFYNKNIVGKYNETAMAEDSSLQRPGNK